MSMEDNDVGFEETKSTILDYFLMFKETKWVVISTIGVSITIFLVVIGLFNILLETSHIFSQTNQLVLLLFGLAILFTLGLWLPISNGGLFLKIITKGKKQQKELLKIQSYLIRRSYLMNFELVEPEIIIKEGNPKLEKIMNHLSFVFPEIDRINKKRIKKNKSVEKYKKKQKGKIHFLRNYDLGIKTSTGWYIIQFYENSVKIRDIEEIIKKFSFEKNIGLEIRRIIIIGKIFDNAFEKENIRSTMDLLKRKIHVDLILENNFGYSTVWID
ncbi:hypothetical protein [Nitrosarchaeum sp.]|uniref:hypothetical protein n=1 Tax=Nitrosarchaeum sp. TaxID=2026886 RepID=UPI00247DCF3A|nr:hypothetical protein [Nitrosarchaeum sp.]MCV0411391.1 hypothetical protein [Nitrosarchaeum sp.]